MTSTPTSDACRNCGDHSTYFAHGVGPHAAQLRCGGCHRMIRWLKKSEAPSREVIQASMDAHRVAESRKQPSLFD